MTVYCCWECRKMLTYRGRGEPDRPDPLFDLREDHWYGCSHCGRDVCTGCASAAGGRCARCGGALQRDRKFPLRLLADGDWREHLPRMDPDCGLLSRNEELVGYATPELVEAIVEAVPSEVADRFWAQIFDWEVQRRLGGLERLVYLTGLTILLDDDWRAKLARIAAMGLGGRGGIDEGALALAERIVGGERGLSRAELIDEIDRALADGRAWLVDVAIDGLARLSPRRADLVRLSAGRVASGDPQVRALGLRALLAGLGRRTNAAHGLVEPIAFALIVEALPRLLADGGAEGVIDRLQAAEVGGELPRWCDALGLGEALVEGVADMLVFGDRRLMRAFEQVAALLPAGHPAIAEAERALADAKPSSSRARRIRVALDLVRRRS